MTLELCCAYLSVALRFALSGIIVYSLLCYGGMINRIQRAGLGIVGGSSFLTMAVIWDVDKHGTPFDQWSGILLSVGCITYFVGAMMRLHVHDRNNRLQVNAARDWMEKRNAR